MKIMVHHDYGNNEVQNARLQPVASDPTSLGANNSGRPWFNTGQGLLKVWNGTGIDTLTNLLESIVGADGAISVGMSGKQATIGVADATSSAHGLLPASGFNLLAGATPNATNSTLAQRDGSGNLAANTFTGALSGTASNAAALGGATLAQVRDFSQTTGTRTRTAISDFDTGVQALRWQSMLAPNAAVNMNSQRLTAVADPTASTDAATKQYVDNIATGLDVKASAKYGTVGALPTNTYSNGVITASANGALSVDGTAVATNDRILVKNESTAANNGLYVVTNTGSGSAAFVLTRSADADNSGNTAEVTGGMFTFIEGGQTLGGTGWVLAGTGNPTLGTTALVFTQFTGGAAYTAGNGLALSANQFSVVGTANRVSVSAGGVDIASTYAGQASITTLGTITTGVWNGSTIPVAYGGTGATTAAGAKTTLGFKGGNATDIPAGTSFTWTHGLGTTDIVPVVQEKATGNIVEADITGITTTQLTVGFAQAVAANAYRVIAIG